jgi:nucleoside-diphosphate-sugar epimerase
MANILILGCGDLGSEIASILVRGEHAVTGVRASDKPFPSQVNGLRADVTNITTLNALSDMHPEIIIYCVAANAQTDESYRLHYVDGLQNVLNTQTQNRQLKHVFFVSSTRVYGQETNALLDELTPACPSDFGGERLLEAEQRLKTIDCPSTVIRLSGIYGPGRQYLVNMAKAPQRWPQSNKWTNRIHRDDAARFIAFLCEEVIAGNIVEDCYIGVDDMPTLQYDVLTWLATKLNIKPPNIHFDEKVSGKRLSNQRMRNAGFELKYANYQVGYSEMLKNV